MDAQMDYRRLWTFGGPVITELVEAYSSRRESPLDVLTRFADLRRTNKVSTLVAKRQRASDNTLQVTPRYSWMLFSIATTLVTLDQFGRSFSAYLSTYESFFASCEVGQIPERIAFLLYLLTYSDVPLKSRRLSSQSFRDSVHRHSKQTLAILKSRSRLEKEFEKWSGPHRRFHKRLWAAVRDYLKEGHEFHEYFRSAIAQSGVGSLSERIARNQDAILVGLEVPGDVWNLRFFRRIFDSPKDIKPRQIRLWFDRLRGDGGLPKNAAVERFDISFLYSPRMSDESRARCEGFRERSD